MATNSRLESQLSDIGVARSGPAGYPMVTRRLEAIVGTRSEPFEVLRDALDLESRLRVNPPGEWRAEKRTVTERSWTGYGSVVRLTKQGRFGSWTVSLDGDVILSDVDRREAFETAAERMRAIAHW
ncbi:hypothetical protein [Natrinema ejinorense]|uniref:Uncharacterized protein n=1 Tax=Natrinema ejinorense TaxID=373386 RepID=A0A2A5QPF4_9EURY|nr:hypothetical protein [Natrinema ejinorense]PCR88689.1 hypothetical protein CP557_21920 [Natrinema ejinorense]